MSIKLWYFQKEIYYDYDGLSLSHSYPWKIEKLSAKQLTDLKAALKASMGSDVALQTKIDASILGGLIVKVGSRMMDNSLKTKLQNLKTAMKGTA